MAKLYEKTVFPENHCLTVIETHLLFLFMDMCDHNFLQFYTYILYFFNFFIELNLFFIRKRENYVINFSLTC